MTPEDVVACLGKIIKTTTLKDLPAEYKQQIRNLLAIIELNLTRK